MYLFLVQAFLDNFKMADAGVDNPENIQLLRVSRNSAGSDMALPGSGWGGKDTGKTEIFDETVDEEDGTGCEDCTG